jgi:hypothetical protein
LKLGDEEHWRDQQSSTRKYDRLNACGIMRGNQPFAGYSVCRVRSSGRDGQENTLNFEPNGLFAQNENCDPGDRDGCCNPPSRIELIAPPISGEQGCQDGRTADRQYGSDRDTSLVNCCEE